MLLELGRHTRATAILPPLHAEQVVTTQLVERRRLRPVLMVVTGRELAPRAGVEPRTQALTVDRDTVTLAIRDEARLHTTQVRLHRGLARLAHQATQVEVSGRLPRHTRLLTHRVDLGEVESAVRAVERTARAAIAGRDLARQLHALHELGRDVRTPQPVVTTARLVVDHGATDLHLVADGLSDTTTDRRLLRAAAARLVVDLDRDRVTLQTAIAHEATVIPHARDRTREVQTALELLDHDIGAETLRDTGDLQPGDTVADDERDLRAALQDLAVAHVVQRAAGRFEHIVHLDVRRLRAEQRERGTRGDRVVPRGLAEAQLRAVQRAAEAGQLDLVERDREVAERRLHGLALQPDIEPATLQLAVAHRTRVSEHRVHLVRIEVRQQPLAAVVIEVLEQRAEVAAARIERRRE